ncbi:D-3-phosphoglycerate dehydrogenase [Cladobotryum mycophilum]|uniref:D-3-phosphoglycerate dehydrogenase n=1 Tax=Cladobotryum mycophilum TaxID=491253 RepID=A0ABR0SKJ4_9HYPO
MATPKSLKIAILDDYQNASPQYFKRFGEAGHDVVVLADTLRPYHHPDTPQSVKDALVGRLEPFHVLSAMRERTHFPAELLRKLPNLKLILTTGSRNAAIDMDVCKERGIVVLTALHGPHSTPKLIDSTTEHIVTMILALARNIAEDDTSVKAGGWQTNFTTALSGKTLGLVGLGRLGGAIGRIFHVAFGTKIIAWSQNLTQEKADQQAKDAGLPVEVNGEKTFKAVSRDELFRTADVVSVHVVLSKRTEGFITSEDLNKMKPSAFFVNTSRGPLVKEADLLSVLKAGKIRGAALDVFELEPLPADSEWRSPEWGQNGRSHVLLTPHTGYVEEETITGWYEEQAIFLDEWIAGKPLRNQLA